MDETKSYLRRGSLTLVAVGVGGVAADYAFNIGLTRLLDPHEYGDFRVASAFAAFFGVAVLLGGDRAAPHALAGPFQSGDSATAWEYLRFYAQLAFALSAVVIAATWAAATLHIGSADPRHHHPVALISIAIPLSALGALASRGLQSAQFPGLAAIPWRIGFPLLKLALILLCAALLGGIHLEHAILLAIAAVAVVTAWQYSELRRRMLPKLVRAPEARTPRLWLQTSVPMMGAFLVSLALNQSDLYFLELLGDESEVGYYSAASTAAHFVILVQATVVGLVAPLARPAIEAGQEASRHAYGRGLRLMAIGLLVVAAVLGLAAEPILASFGPEYPAAAPELLLLAVGNLAWASAALAVLWLQFSNRGLSVLVCSVSVLVLDSALNLLLIPSWGMRGAAASTALTLTLAAAGLLLLFRRTVHRA